MIAGTRRQIAELRAWRRRARMAGSDRRGALDALVRTQTIFVHVPKCGGKAIISSLYELKEHDYFGHPDIQFYRALLGPTRFESFTKFAVLRDPVERCRSAFYFVRQGGFGLSPMAPYAKQLRALEFDDFVQNGILSGFLDDYLMFRPQHSFVCDASGCVLVDHLCNLTYMAEDLEKAVGDRLPVHQLTRVNASKYSRSESVSKDSRTMIESLYAKDLDLIHSFTGRADGAA